MSVARICMREVDLADAQESAQAAAKRMLKRNVGTLIIVDEDNKPVGIVTDRDLMARVVAKGKDPGKVKVEAVMTHPLTVVDENTPIEDALALMSNKALRRLPIVDEQGKLAGVVSSDDFVGLLSEEISLIGHMMDKQAARIDTIGPWRVKSRTPQSGGLQ